MAERRHTVDDLLTKLDTVRELLNQTTGTSHTSYTLRHPSDGSGTWRAAVGNGTREEPLPGSLHGYLGRTKTEAAATLDTIRWTLLEVRRKGPEQSVTEELAHLRAQLVTITAERNRAEEKLSAFTWPSQP